MAQDPQSLEDLLVTLEQPLRVLGRLSEEGPVAEPVKGLRHAARYVVLILPLSLPHLPDRSGLTLAPTLTPTLTLPRTLTLTLTLTRFVLPHFPGKSGLGALEPALGSIHATVGALRP
jgi:hypothetical protein